MELQNTSTSPITVGGVYTVPAKGTADVPWIAVRADDAALVSLLTGALIPITPPEIDWAEPSTKTYWGIWLDLSTLTANQVYPIPTDCFVGALGSEGRINLITEAGSATFSLRASADGGTTFIPLSDFSDVTMAPPGTAVPIPPGCVLLQGTITAGSSGWTGQVQVSLVDN